MYNLEAKPGNTVEYVNSLTFLDDIQDQIDEKEKQSETVKKLYDLIEEYTVPTPPEDLAVYQVSGSISERGQVFNKEWIVVFIDFWNFSIFDWSYS